LVLYFLAFFCLVLFPQSIFGYISLLFILPGALATAVTIPSALYFIFVPIAGIQNYIFDFLPIQELMVSPSSNPINMFIMVGLLSSIIINVPLWAMIIGGLVDFVKKHKKNV